MDTKSSVVVRYADTVTYTGAAWPHDQCSLNWREIIQMGWGHSTRHMAGTVCNHQQNLTLPSFLMTVCMCIANVCECVCAGDLGWREAWVWIHSEVPFSLDACLCEKAWVSVCLRFSLNASQSSICVFSLSEFSKQQHLQVKAGWRPGAAACLLCPANLLWLWHAFTRLLIWHNCNQDY